MNSSKNISLYIYRFPYAELELEEMIYGRPLNEVDCDYLIERNFAGWQKFLINQYYRMELNINDPVTHPLPLNKNATTVTQSLNIA